MFGLGLMTNAGLFVIQAVKTVWARSSKGVSKFTSAGFSALQMTGILHGFYQQDWDLLTGMVASVMACGTVTVPSIVFREKPHRM